MQGRYQEKQNKTKHREEEEEIHSYKDRTNQQLSLLVFFYLFLNLFSKIFFHFSIPSQHKGFRFHQIKKQWKKMAEEQRCQAQPEGHRLCANNCGFFGSPATLNLCSKCYRDHCLKEEQASSAKFAVEKSLAGPSPSASLLIPPSITLPAAAADEVRNPIVLVSAPSPMESSPVVVVVPSESSNRCLTCRKRVGLTGFRCRCGTTFCGIHRYPEQHGCTFDFKGVGREAIAKANPIVKAAKLDKI